MPDLAPVQDQFARPLRDLRISVIDQCNLRCGYCMPAAVFGRNYPFLKKAELLTFSEITLLAEAFAQLGVRKLRLTGGEPLLRPKLEELITRLVDIPHIEEVALTTNATLLAPSAHNLWKTGLTRITISLDAIDDTVFRQMNGVNASVDKVKKGIEAALDAGFTPKLNCVLERGVNDNQIIPLARYAREHGLTLRFIEYMDVGNHNEWSPRKVIPSPEVWETIHQEMPLHPLLPTQPGEVATRYGYNDGKGEIGLISSISKPFCQNCNRARLSAEGKLFTCLFAHVGNDLKTLLRPDKQALPKITAHLGRLWQKRQDRYSENRERISPANKKPAKVEMSYIGG